MVSGATEYKFYVYTNLACRGCSIGKVKNDSTLIFEIEWLKVIEIDNSIKNM